jgi:hypothetical protein
MMGEVSAGEWVCGFAAKLARRVAGSKGDGDRKRRWSGATGLWMRRLGRARRDGIGRFA